MSCPRKGPSVLGEQIKTAREASACFPVWKERFGEKIFRYDGSESQGFWLAMKEPASVWKAERPRALHPQLSPPASGTQPSKRRTTLMSPTTQLPHPGDITPPLLVDLGSIKSGQFGCVKLNVLSFSPQINSFYVNIGISSPHEG